MPQLCSFYTMAFDPHTHEPHLIRKQRPSPAFNGVWKSGTLLLLLILLARPSLAVLAVTSGSQPPPQQPLREPPPAVNSTSQVQQQPEATANCCNTGLPPFSEQDPPPPPLPPREAGPGIGEVAWLVLPWLDGNSLVQVAIPWAASWCFVPAGVCIHWRCSSSYSLQKAHVPKGNSCPCCSAHPAHRAESGR
jgi:hypothetical protein